MEKHGNEKVNKFYEKHVTNEKPNPKSTKQEKETFINSKYIQVKFGDFEILPEPPKNLPMFKEGYLYNITNNISKKRWFKAKITKDSAKLFYFRSTNVSF